MLIVATPIAVVKDAYFFRFISLVKEFQTSLAVISLFSVVTAKTSVCVCVHCAWSYIVFLSGLISLAL
jgi:hypothetical protein